VLQGLVAGPSWPTSCRIGACRSWPS